jgi:hypothetical protein
MRCRPRVHQNSLHDLNAPVLISRNRCRLALHLILCVRVSIWVQGRAATWLLRLNGMGLPARCAVVACMLVLVRLFGVEGRPEHAQLFEL